MKLQFEDRIEKAYGSIASRVKGSIRTGVILGSGLSGVAQAMGGEEIPFSGISEFPESTVQGHRGSLFLGEGYAVLAGRFHFYEGYTMDDVVLPVFLLRRLGAENIIVSNAAGGINSSYRPGELVLIKDHINLLGTNPLIGPNPQNLGPRFPDMSSAYPKTLRDSAMRVSGIRLHEGVYAAMTGPSYETPAEIRMLRTIGADMVGMSTVPEVIAACYLGMKVLGVSCITNFAAGIAVKPLSHQEVVETGKQVESDLKKLIVNMIREFDT